MEGGLGPARLGPGEGARAPNPVLPEGKGQARRSEFQGEVALGVCLEREGGMLEVSKVDLKVAPIPAQLHGTS